jgi:biotin carboxylase
VESNTTGTGRDFAEAARRRGLRPILLSSSPGRFPYVSELALDVDTVDTSSVATVEAACRRLGSAGVRGITSSSEYFIQTAATVAQSLGLPAPDPDAVGRCRDKTVQRRWLRAAGVAVPDFVECESEADAVAAATAMAARVVVKPVFGTGSQGVRACGDPLSAGRWARHLLGTGARVLVEREAVGPEYSVEILAGEVVGLTRKHVGDAPYFVEIGHDFPAQLPEAAAAALRSAARRAVRAIGLLTGPAHVELRLTDDTAPVLIEINPRLAGGLIPRLVRYATGRDLVGEVVARVAGLRAESSVPGAGYSSIRFVLPQRAGLVGELIGLDVARALPGVVEALCPVSAGSELTIEHSFVDRKGHVITIGRTAHDAISTADRAIGAIEIVYAPAVAPVAAGPGGG